MRKRLYSKGRIIDIVVHPVRGGGWTSHFDIEDHRTSRPFATHYELGKVFMSPQAAVDVAIRQAKMRI
jgi:hypothetical protein